MDAEEEEKPQCGGGQESGEYDIPLHVAGLFLVMLASIIGAGFPVMAKKLPGLKIPTSVFFACKHFGTGVLVATAFAHLLPEAFGSLTDPCLPDFFIEDYPPFTGVLMMCAMFALFYIEMFLHEKTGGHSHGNADGTIGVPARRSMMMGPGGFAPPRPTRPYSRSFDLHDRDRHAAQGVDEKEFARQMYDEKERYPYVGNPFDDPNNNLPPGSEMPAWFIVFYEQYVRQRLEMMNIIKAQDAKNEQDKRYMMENAKHQHATADVAPAPSATYDVEGQVDPAVLKKMSMNISLLEGGILFHSIFVGITVSLTIEGYLVLIIAIIFHQMFEGLGLGSRIAEVPFPKTSPRPWILVCAFGCTAPIGMAIGIAVQGTYDPDSALGLILVGVFNSISFGLLIWAALVDLLAEDFLSEESDRVMNKRKRNIAFCWVLLGAAGMSILGAFA